MYGRDYGGRELHFEASGGLILASLVMQDKETDSYWSIMTGTALDGAYGGTQLEELPWGVKMQWKDWVARHPGTLVLSVEGAEDGEHGYERYFESEEGFRGLEAADDRLATKAPVYTFRRDERAVAVPFAAFEGDGRVFALGGVRILLHRPRDVAIFHSTAAFRTTGRFERGDDGVWRHDPSGAVFDPVAGAFAGGTGEGPHRLGGFDTFWDLLSLVHPDTDVLGLE